jgi:uncharacterized membrane protein YsdA (DUF1294 family)
MPYFPILAFAAVYAAATFAWGVPVYVAFMYLFLSVLCFTVYAADKSAARSRARRTPERTLLLLGLAGGWPGAVLAQQWLRHKSAKASFRARFWVTVCVNAAAFVVAASQLGGQGVL